MKDNVARRSIKALAGARYLADLALTRWVLGSRGEPGFRLRGHCNHCGACCETPMIPMYPIFFHLKSARRLTITWHRLVNGFEFIGEERPSHTLIFRCTHWDPQAKRCDSYSIRPGMCRDYPRNLLYSANPSFLDGCGHYAESTQADLLREALDEVELPPEKRAELERKLHIRREKK